MRKMETVSRDNSWEELNWEGKGRDDWGLGVGGATHADIEVSQVDISNGNVKEEDDKLGTQVLGGWKRGMVGWTVDATGKGERCGHEQCGSQGEKNNTVEAAFGNKDSNKPSNLRLCCRG